jgi:hypothetical protein
MQHPGKTRIVKILTGALAFEPAPAWRTKEKGLTSLEEMGPPMTVI